MSPASTSMALQPYNEDKLRELEGDKESLRLQVIKGLEILVDIIAFFK